MNNPVLPLGLSTRGCLKDGNKIEWGPNGLFAVSSENFVTIYRYCEIGVKLVRTITRHKSNITCFKFNNPTVELSQQDPFQIFLSVGDEGGNCIIYDVFTGKRHAGLSPEQNMTVSISGMCWHYSKPSVLYLLTSQPSLICFSLGNIMRRRSSTVESCSEHGLNFMTFNMECIWSHPLKSHFSFMCISPFSQVHIVIANSSSQFAVIKINADLGLSTVSTTSCFSVMLSEQKLLTCEFFPFTQNRLTLLYQNYLGVYDIAKSELSILFNDKIHQYCPTNIIFSPYSPEYLLVGTFDGSINRYILMHDKWVIQSVTSIGSRLSMVSGNPYDQKLFLSVSKCGKLIVYKEQKNNFFAVGIVPSNPETINAWAVCEDSLMYVTNLGNLVVFHKNQEYRFFIDDRKIFFIELMLYDKIILAGRHIYMVDIKKRSVILLSKVIDPLFVAVSGPYVAYSPLKNVIDFIDISGNKSTHVLAETIVLLSANRTNQNIWAVFTSHSTVTILDTSHKVPNQQKFAFKEAFGEINCASFNETKLVAVSSSGIVYTLDIDTKLTTSFSFASCSLKYVRAFSDRLLIIDNEYACTLCDSTTLNRISIAKWRVIDANFLDQDHCVIQTSPSSMRVMQTPSFDTCTLNSEYESSLFIRFQDATSLNELCEIAKEVGDLEFLQFVGVLQRSEKLPLPNPSCIIRDVYIKFEESILASEHAYSKEKESLIEYLILMGKMNEVSNLLLKKNDENSILTAYACLAPSSQSIMRIAETIDISGNEKFIAKLFAITGDRDSSLRLLIETKECDSALKYAKIMFSDDEICPYLSMISSKQSIRDQIFMNTFAKDYKSVSELLNSVKSISKLKALEYFVRENAPKHDH